MKRNGNKKADLAKKKCEISEHFELAFNNILFLQRTELNSFSAKHTHLKQIVY